MLFEAAVLRQFLCFPSVLHAHPPDVDTVDTMSFSLSQFLCFLRLRARRIGG